MEMILVSERAIDLGGMGAAGAIAIAPPCCDFDLFKLGMDLAKQDVSYIHYH
jgi:hypothetical protein